MAARPRAAPFRRAAYDLGPGPDGRPLTLDALCEGEPEALGAAFAAIDPWATYRYLPAELAAFFAEEKPHSVRLAVRLDGHLAGVVVVRLDWLHGPYLHFLGLVPGHEGRGIGQRLLAWMEQEAGPAARNLWLCVSGINPRARAFYERHGYERVAVLDSLARDGMDELLMRKRLA